MERLRSNQALAGALTAITAAVVGVILNLAIWFAVHTVFREVTRFEAGPFEVELPVLATVDVWALLLTVAVVVAMFRFRTGVVPTLLAASAAGLGLHLLGAIG